MTRHVTVTGATGRLGRALVPRLVEAGHVVRALSRRPGPPPSGPSGTSGGALEWRTVDLRDEDAVRSVLAGTDTVVHCATTNGRRDVDVTHSLLSAAATTGVGHLIDVSIVGVDRVDLPYYRAKLACERLVEESGVPWTIQRATQFHDLLVAVFAAQRRLPVVLVPAGVSFQPVDVRDVVERLVALVESGPAGRAADVGGPEIRPVSDLARDYLRAVGSRRRVVSARVPGSAMRGYRAGGHLAPEHATGTRTFTDYLSGLPR